MDDDTDDALKVYYPYGGRTFILSWSSAHNRGHLWLGRTREQVEHYTRRLIEDQPTLELTQFIEAEIVAPSLEMEEVAAQVCYQDHVHMFFTHARAHAKNYFDRHGVMPEPFAPCPGYSAPLADPDEPEYIPPTEEDDSYHFDCTACEERVRLVGMTKVELYESCREAFEAYDKKRKAAAVSQYRRTQSRQEPQRQFSKAPRATDDSPVSAAFASHGPHGKGTYLGPTVWDANIREEYLRDGIRPPFLANPVLFYYQHEVHLPVVDLQAALHDAEAARVKKWVRHREEDHSDYERECQRIEDEFEAVLAHARKKPA